MLTVAGSLLILGAGLAVAAEQSQAVQTEPGSRNRVESRRQTRLMFVDENGDGICDLFRDHDNDGIPNRQDPDWDRPQDGSGFQNGNGQRQGQAHFNGRNAFQNGDRGWSHRSFRNNRSGLGDGVCDETGPKGNGFKRGGK
jgi:hypothetical protein